MKGETKRAQRRTSVAKRSSKKSAAGARTQAPSGKSAAGESRASSAKKSAAQRSGGTPRGTGTKRGASSPRSTYVTEDTKPEPRGRRRTIEPPRGFGVIMGDTADSLLPKP
jgi:hypothetical protein